MKIKITRQLFLYSIVHALGCIGYEDAGHRDTIFITSIPKCGTHLLEKCIELLTKRTNPFKHRSAAKKCFEVVTKKTTEQIDFFQWHTPYSRWMSRIFKEHNVKVFFIYRDPRDKAVSRVYYIYDGQWEKRDMDNPLRQLPFDKLLRRVISDLKSPVTQLPLLDEYGAFLSWIDDPSCCAVRFEDLVGPQGGGTRKAQVRAIKKIASHIDPALALDDLLINECVKNLFGGTPTFREGKIGAWKTSFKKRHKKLFKCKLGELLIKLKYEKNYNW